MDSGVDPNIISNSVNSYKRERTMGDAIKQAPMGNFELNIMIQQQIIDSPGKQKLVRKQSTIHQARTKMRKKHGGKGQSPNGSEYSVENWVNARQNQSELTSQNSLLSQQMSIRQKNQAAQSAAFLDQMILENQM